MQHTLFRLNFEQFVKFSDLTGYTAIRQPDRFANRRNAVLVTGLRGEDESIEGVIQGCGAVRNLRQLNNPLPKRPKSCRRPTLYVVPGPQPLPG